MRDKERIDRIIKKVAEIWKNTSDLRFFQFITYLGSRINYQGDFFFLEDDRLEDELNKIIKENNESKSRNKKVIY